MSERCLEQLQTTKPLRENEKERHFINHCWNAASFPAQPHLLNSFFLQVQFTKQLRADHHNHDTICSCGAEQFKKNSSSTLAHIAVMQRKRSKTKQKLIR